MAKNNKQGKPFVLGVVKKKLGPLTYLIETKDGLTWKIYTDHLKSLGHNVLESRQCTDDDESIYPSWLDNPQITSNMPETHNDDPAPVPEQVPM